MRTILTTDDGAEVLEFGVVAPVLFLLIFGIIFALVTLASQVSLSHATAVGARYASMPVDPAANLYPTEEDVAAKVDNATPFFTASNCTSTVVGDSKQNAEVVLDVACRLPNPLGSSLNKLLHTTSFGDVLTVSARAAARRE